MMTWGILELPIIFLSFNDQKLVGHMKRRYFVEKIAAEVLLFQVHQIFGTTLQCFWKSF